MTDPTPPAPRDDEHDWHTQWVLTQSMLNETRAKLAAAEERANVNARAVEQIEVHRARLEAALREVRPGLEVAWWSVVDAALGDEP